MAQPDSSHLCQDNRLRAAGTAITIPPSLTPTLSLCPSLSGCGWFLCQQDVFLPALSKMGLILVQRRSIKKENWNSDSAQSIILSRPHAHTNPPHPSLLPHHGSSIYQGDAVTESLKQPLLCNPCGLKVTVK